MLSDLFREEALNYQSASSSRLGNPTGVWPPTWTALTILLVVFVAMLIAFLSTVEFARKETVRGKLRVDGAESKLFALEEGIITSVLVSDGQSVVARDPLFEITTERYMNDGVSVSDTTLEQLDLEIAALYRRRSAVEEASMLSKLEAQQRFQSGVRREQELRAQLSVAETRLSIAQKRAVDALQFLKEQLIAEPQLAERRESAASLELLVLQTKAELSAAIAAQESAALEERLIDATLAGDLAELDQRIAQLNAQASLSNAERSHIVHAPIDGRITSLRAREGENAIPGVLLGAILPEESSLIAEVYVPSRAVGFVEPGQLVNLQYDAFPFQKFGVAVGEIINVANIAQPLSEIGVANSSTELIYVVQIKLELQSVDAFTKKIPLQPGMELTADIILEDRRLLEWLLDPFRS